MGGEEEKEQELEFTTFRELLEWFGTAFVLWPGAYFIGCVLVAGGFEEGKALFEWNNVYFAWALIAALVPTFWIVAVFFELPWSHPDSSYWQHTDVHSNAYFYFKALLWFVLFAALMGFGLGLKDKLEVFIGFAGSAAVVFFVFLPRFWMKREAKYVQRWKEKRAKKENE